MSAVDEAFDASNNLARVLLSQGLKINIKHPENDTSRTSMNIIGQEPYSKKTIEYAVKIFRGIIIEPKPIDKLTGRLEKAYNAVEDYLSENGFQYDETKKSHIKTG